MKEINNDVLCMQEIDKTLVKVDHHMKYVDASGSKSAQP